MRTLHRVAPLLALLAAATTNRADPARPPVATAYEEDDTGLIVEVRLSTLRPGRPDRVFRFLLDTGATTNVVDLSVPPEYYWDEPDDGLAPPSTKDGSGVDLPAEFVALKSMAVGGIVKPQQLALRMDLRSSLMGRRQDRPVDGLIGMNFLRDTRFVIDPKAHAIYWGASATGHRVKLDGTGAPLLPVTIDGAAVPFLLDTGSGSGFSGPGEPDGPGPFEPVYMGGLSGNPVEGSRVLLDKVEANGRAWLHVPGSVYSTPDAWISVGRCVLLADRLGLDFIYNWAVFQTDAAGNLPVAPCVESDLSVEWLWIGDHRELRIGWLGPRSRMSRAGFKAGDRVVRVGPMAGAALNIRAILEQVAASGSTTWDVVRDGEALRLQLPAAAREKGVP
jgi:hypothetical protein